MEKLFITDERMLIILAESVARGIAEHEKDYFEKIGFQRTNISNVRKGTQSFTKEHILAAAELTGVNINWLFGLENNMMRKEPVDILENLKNAVTAVETEFARVSQKESQKASKKVKSGKLKK